VFRFDRGRARFALHSVHPGHTVAEVAENTGFAFDLPGEVAETPPPSAATLALIRGPVGRAIAETYPGFALSVLGVAA
jgi:glutaconate CoA-transferase subunit B